MMLGQLVPQGGGDTIPLTKDQLKMGRRESCDIVLRFSNVSAYHCLLTLEEGYWFVQDLNSRNGVKVNGSRVTGETRKRVDPGDELSVAKHVYQIEYLPSELGAVGAPPADHRVEPFMNRSLLERAGLESRPSPRGEPKQPDGRIDVNDHSENQLKHRKKNNG